jgi:transposase
MPKKQYQIQLTDEERSKLTGLLKKGTIAVRKLARALLLRLADAGKQDAEIAESVGVGLSTVERTRKKYVEGGLDQALNEAPRPGGQAAAAARAACSPGPRA